MRVLRPQDGRQYARIGQALPAASANRESAGAGTVSSRFRSAAFSRRGSPDPAVDPGVRRGSSLTDGSSHPWVDTAGRPMNRPSEAPGRRLAKELGGSHMVAARVSVRGGTETSLGRALQLSGDPHFERGCTKLLLTRMRPSLLVLVIVA